MKIKLGAGGKPLMAGGKVVTNCDCCAGGGGPCFSASNVRVTFSGVVMDCGCLHATGTGSFSVITNNLNAAFVLPLASSGTGFSYYTDNPTAVVTCREYGDSNNCSTTPGDNNRPARITVYCTDGTNGDPAGTYVMAVPQPGTVPTDYYAAFYAHDSATGITSLTNEFTCGLEIVDGIGDDFFGMAHSGTATIEEI